MKQLKYSHSKTFHYDNAEERLSHIKEMELQGWVCTVRLRSLQVIYISKMK